MKVFFVAVVTMIALPMLTFYGLVAGPESLVFPLTRFMFSLT